MKTVIFLLFLNIFGFLNCHNQNTKINSSKKSNENTVTQKQEMISFQDKVGDINYDYKFQVEKNFVRINYKLTNTGKNDYLIFNRGDSQKGYQKGLIYTEPVSETLIEISQKIMQEPQNSGCPDRYMPIRAGASWLKAGETVTESVEVAFSSKPVTPFDDCTRLPQFSGKETEFRFCLGVAQADSSKTKVDESGAVENWSSVKPQQLLCSKNIKIN